MVRSTSVILIYLCDLLADEAVRREVHEARQVVETWNSGIDFIHYGKNSELTGEDREDLEISMLAMHVLQSSLVLVNTLILQQILAEPEWARRLTDRDRKALSALIWPSGSNGTGTYVKPDNHPARPRRGRIRLRSSAEVWCQATGRCPRRASRPAARSSRTRLARRLDRRPGLQGGPLCSSSGPSGAVLAGLVVGVAREVRADHRLPEPCQARDRDRTPRRPRQDGHRHHCYSHSGVRSRYCLTVNYTRRLPPKFHDDRDILPNCAGERFAHLFGEERGAARRGPTHQPFRTRSGQGRRATNAASAGAAASARAARVP